MKEIYVTRKEPKSYYSTKQLTCTHCNNKINPLMVCVNQWRPGGIYNQYFFCPIGCVNYASKKYGLSSTRTQIISFFEVEIVNELPYNTKRFVHQLPPTFVSGTMSSFEFAVKNPLGTNKPVHVDDRTKLAGRESFGDYDEKLLDGESMNEKKKISRGVTIGDPQAITKADIKDARQLTSEEEVDTFLQELNKSTEKAIMIEEEKKQLEGKQ